VALELAFIEQRLEVMDHDHSPHSHSRVPRSVNWIMWGFVGVAAFFLITEHRAHLYGFLPYLLLLACPLMHLFMHHGHGGRNGHGARGPDTRDVSRKDVDRQQDL
jgi:hypothetical protein